MLMARFTAGVGIGVGLLSKPLIVSELAPPSRRGMLVSTFQLGIAAGTLISFVLRSALPDEGAQWRLLFAAGGLPPLALLALASSAVPEPPQWAVPAAQQRLQRARSFLASFGANASVHSHRAATTSAIKASTSLDLRPLLRARQSGSLLASLLADERARCALQFNMAAMAAYNFGGAYVVLSFAAALPGLFGGRQRCAWPDRPRPHPASRRRKRRAAVRAHAHGRAAAAAARGLHVLDDDQHGAARALRRAAAQRVPAAGAGHRPRLRLHLGTALDARLPAPKRGGRRGATAPRLCRRRARVHAVRAPPAA
mmetsp:Transcript_7564/g.17665  ORF Transcript_7564/g.17665 Transcript_7564/m.17665 type:complete len:312 (-) Transcript_7564:595-1530(-)